MLKILQARPQQYVNQKLQDVQAEFRKGREEQEVKLLASISSTEKAREFQKNIYFCLIDYAKDFLWITSKFGKFLEMRISDPLICLLGSLYADQEAAFRTGHGKMEWFKMENVVHQSTLSPCLFNLYTEFIM